LHHNLPGLRRLPPGDSFRVFSASEDYFGIDEIDMAKQRAVSHHLTIVDEKLKRFCMPFRYVWPSELDLMAELAGMRLRARWDDWSREPFTSDSRKHVSVWEKPKR
jgi:hypothetical protein